MKEGDTEYLWIADNGRKRTPETGYEYPGGFDSVYTGQAVKMTLDGDTVMRLAKPPLAIYDGGTYAPTWVAVNEERNGGNGDVWVTDGYGQNHAHRFTKGGDYLNSINGEEGEVGAFDTPHAILIDTRKSEPELYVADRSSGRVQVYDVVGNFKRGFGSDFLISPSGFATHGDLMIIAELNARLTIVDIDDNLVAYLGDNHEVADVPGWPQQPRRERQDHSEQAAGGRQVQQPARHGRGRRRQHIRRRVAHRRPVSSSSTRPDRASPSRRGLTPHQDARMLCATGS